MFTHTLVIFDRAQVTGSATARALIAAVQQGGYGVEVIQDEDEHRRRQQQTAERATRRYSRQSALALCVPLMAWGGVLGGSMALTPATSLPWLGAVGLLTLVVMVVAGGRFYRSAANSLRNGSATMDTLVALETGAVQPYSISVVLWPQAFSTVARHLYFEASAMIIGLINLGHALERLLELTPPSSRIVVDDREHFTLLAQVTPGVTLRLTSGDWVPVDGDIFQGEV